MLDHNGLTGSLECGSMYTDYVPSTDASYAAAGTRRSSPAFATPCGAFRAGQQTTAPVAPGTAQGGPQTTTVANSGANSWPGPAAPAASFGQRWAQDWSAAKEAAGERPQKRACMEQSTGLFGGM